MRRTEHGSSMTASPPVDWWIATNGGFGRMNGGRTCSLRAMAAPAVRRTWVFGSLQVSCFLWSMSFGSRCYGGFKAGLLVGGTTTVDRAEPHERESAPDDCPVLC